MINKLKIEHFSGYSKQSILQDFYAALFVSNVQRVIIGDLAEELKQINQNKKYDYKINTNLSYGFMKNRIIDIFLKNKNMEEEIEKLKKLFKKHLIPIRPKRSFQRNIGKYRTRIKPKITKNQKDVL